MQLNQIILDIFDWIRRSLWYRQKKVALKPYEILEIYPSDKGVLKLVRRDTPRAVRTFIFTPYTRKETPNLVQKDMRDIHICLDHLWALDSEQNSHLPRRVEKDFRKVSDSHAVTILEASRWIKKDGNYNSTVLYSGNYDFIGSDIRAYRDKYAIPIVNDLANLLRYRALPEMDWRLELELSQKNFMGGHFIRRNHA